MDIAEIRMRLDLLAKDMGKKALITPAAELQITSGQEDVIWLWHVVGTDRAYKTFRGDEKFQVASDWIAALPSPDEHHRAEFLRLAGQTADYAAKHLPDDPIATEVRSGIVTGMQRLSDNALTHVRQQ